MDMQLRELLTRYGDVFLIWFDGLGLDYYDPWRFHKTIHEFQPACLINNRVGLPGDYQTPEQFVPARVPVRSSRAELRGLEAESPKQAAEATFVPEPSDFQPWESCITINGTWAYNRNDTRYKSTTELIRTLIDLASRGGNLLLNVGPGPDGTIQPEFEERLRGIGKWLEVNGEAIYGTSYGLIQGLPFGRVTTKGKTLYVHVFEWPKGGEIAIPRVPGRVTVVELLASRTRLKFSQTGATVRIQGPAASPDPTAAVLTLSLK
jgi:alpha-L-fucosidase